MSFFKKIKWWIYNWIGFMLIIWLSSVAYWAYVSLTDVTNWATLTASLFNQVLENQRTLKTSIVPAWFIWSFNLSTCPPNWIPADGTNWTPDLRGEFIRWLDSGRWVDSSRTLWTFQKPSITIWDRLSHSMITWLMWNGTTTNRSEYWWEDPSLSWYTANFPNWWYWYVSAWAVTYGFLDIAVLWTVRPRNVALLYCVKQ